MKRKLKIAYMPWGWACWLLLLLGCVQAHAESSTKVKPTVKFNPTSLEVTVGQQSFTRPVLEVTDPTTGTSIRGRFIQRWGIEGVKDSKYVDSRVKFYDPTTGSCVAHIFGLDSIGNKPGTFVVVDTLLPQPRYKDKYDNVVVNYTVTVKSPTVTAEYYNGSTLLNGTTPAPIQLFTYGNGGGSSTSIPVPTAKLYYTVDNSTYDVTSYYDYTYTVTDGFALSNNSITSSLKDQSGTGTLTIKATPKDDYKAMLGSDPIVTTIDLKSTYRTEKIKTYITFASHEQDVLRYRNLPGQFLEHKSYSPNIIIKDQFDNDITSLVYSKTSQQFFSASYKEQNAFNKFSTDPNDAVKNGQEPYILKDEHTGGMNDPQVNFIDGKIRLIIDNHDHPDDYIMTVTFKAPEWAEWNEVFGKNGLYEAPQAYTETSTVEGQFYSQNSADQYTVQSNQFVLRVHKRAPEIKLTPDPSTISFAQGYTMTQFNRFDISCVFHDPYESSDPDEVRHALDSQDGFTYWFFVPDEYKYDESKTEDENKAKAKELGHALIRINTAAMQDPTSKVQTGRQEWVPAYNTDGTPKKDENGKQVQELLTGTYYMSMKGYGNETFTVTFYGDGLYAPLIYKNVPWNFAAQNVRSTNTYTIKITEKEPTHFVIDPKSQVTGVSGVVPCPSIAVQDQFGADVTSLFTVTRKKGTTSDDYTLADDGSVTAKKEGTYNVTVSGTLADAASATSTGRFFNNPADDSYTAVFKPTSQGSVGAYEIIYDANEFSTDAKTKASSKMGKLHFIQAGDFYPGTISYGEVPGINITFGNANDISNTWSIVTSTKGEFVDNDNNKDAGNISKKYIVGDAVKLGSNGLPESGCFLKIDAVTNGWLTVDCNFLGHKSESSVGAEIYYLVDATTMEVQSHSESENDDNIKEYTFPKPLLATHTYYLYTNDGQMRVHGLSYTPGFIDPVTDAKPWTTPGAVDTAPVTVSSAFVNGYTGALPTLAMHHANEKVTWHVMDVASGSTSTSVDDIKEYTNDDAEHVYVGKTDGRIYAEKITTEKPLTDDKRKGTDAYGRVQIFAKVMGKKLSDGKQVMKKPAYWLFVGAMPTYQVSEGEVHDQADRVSTTNIPTRIWMTFGGWKWTSGSDYPYFKGNKEEDGWLSDGWKTAKMDSVGRNEQTIDGFAFTTWGEQNPTDEQVVGWDKGNRNTFNLPVRGTYLKFEPEESGQLFVYLCQNGMTDNTKGADEAKLKKNGPWLRRRAVYIVDETGNPVTIDDNSGWTVADDWNQYINAGVTNADRYPGYHNYKLNYFCDGKTRCAWQYDTTGAQPKELEISTAGPATASGDEKKYSWFSAYDLDHDGTLSKTEQDNLDADVKTIKDWWTAASYSYSKTVNGKTLTSNLDHAKLDGPLEVLQMKDGSFVLPTKGYTRYTFHVLAGKTYYVFATGSKLGFCGFGFLPAGYRSNPDKWIDAGQPNEYGEFSDDVYAKLPQPSDDIYKPGNQGQNRLMGGEATLDVSKKAEDKGSYDKFLRGSYVLSSDNSNGLTASDNPSRDFVNVTLTRTFRNQRWHGICLPFSLSETQVHKVFGDDAVVITFDSIMTKYDDHEDRTIHFTQHSNQLMEAGRPYFIRPNWTGMDEGAEKTSVTFNQVTFEGKDAMSLICYNEGVKKVHEDYKKGKAPEDKNIFTYKITGVYDKTLIPWYSYFMRNTTKADENKLYRIVPAEGSTTKGAYLPGMNVYLYPYSGDVSGQDLVETGEKTDDAKAASFWITGAEVAGGTVTDIEGLVDEINTEATHFVSGVYNLQGQRVSATNSLQGLQPGIYIMGGKKYVVK